MTQQRGRGLASQPIPPHKIRGDSTLSQRVDTMIDNAKSMGGKGKAMPTLPQPAAADATSRPSLGQAGARTAKQFDDDRRSLAAHADSVLSGKAKN